MSLDASDLVDAGLTEQARRNSAIDSGDINNLITDFAGILPVETIGMQADTITPVATGLPHKWDDAQTAWGFWSWDT